ncbi:hypothetical protein LFYK43_09870 [Ligilactobacillus salitolerans]|uniref:Uncharacterized protein n=1 Tax=Ligilactobacillus salitolerans TaxID=1808352 RepID=A0A401ISM3_9LACO|nr:hypothetical protein [Ligilactobacillus salitolerans]GBG94528.1 hypothetical protein LFYK43_09870 [Ligilactobacillus salitolerans]
MLFLSIVSALLVLSLVRRIYLQSQLQLKAKYNFSPVLSGMIFLGFLTPLLNTMGANLVFEVLFAALILLTFLAGRNGLTDQGILLPNLFTRLLKFQQVVKVSLKPMDVSEERKVIVATFIEKASLRRYALVFEMSLNELTHLLQKCLPAETEIESAQ